MIEFRLSDVLGMLVCALFAMFIGWGMIYGMASNVCLEDKDAYFRYETRGGIFGGITQVETTAEHADEIGKKCIKYYDARFLEIDTNIETIANYSRSGERR